MDARRSVLFALVAAFSIWACSGDKSSGSALTSDTADTSVDAPDADATDGSGSEDVAIDTDADAETSPDDADTDAPGDTEEVDDSDADVESDADGGSDADTPDAQDADTDVDADADADADDTDTDTDEPDTDADVVDEETDGDTDAGPICGDGFVGEGEECDDGEGNSNDDPDACRLDCRSAFCGDGVVDAEEDCDGEPAVDCDEFGFPYGIVLCTDCGHDGTLCTDEEIVVCGDGVIGEGEGCDDGNAEDGDGCTSLCQVCVDDDAEEDDDTERAVSLATAEPVSRVLQSDDDDVFEMFLLPGCAIYLDATFAHADGDLQLEVLNIAGEVIGTPGHSDTDNERAIFAPDGFFGGNFYARAYAEGPGACVPYTIVWNCFDPDE